MFKLLAVLLAGYTLYALLEGEVFAKSGAWGKHIRRSEEPFNFMFTIVIYFLLALAMFFYF